MDSDLHIIRKRIAHIEWDLQSMTDEKLRKRKLLELEQLRSMLSRSPENMVCGAQSGKPGSCPDVEKNARGF